MSPTHYAQDHDLSHSMAHYLLAIHRLKEEKGYARVTDIARIMNLTKGSVSTALSGLKKKGLVQEEDESKFLFLSDLGHKEVHNILSSRTLIFYFLKDVLQVSEEVARRDSCLMEHLLGEETREKFFHFMKNYNKGGLDLSSFENAKQFEDVQRGDSYLKRQ